MRTADVIAIVLFVLASGAVAADKGEQLHNAALTTLGATAKGSGAQFNANWPANNALLPDRARGGTIFGVPLVGGRVDIRLVVPVEIKAIELIGLDYHGTRQPAAVDIFVEGEKVASTKLPNQPGKPFRIPLQGRGRRVGVLVTAEHPIRQVDGRPGPAWGGWRRIRVWSTTDVAALMRDVDEYDVPAAAANIAPTSGSAVTGEVQVHGEPRQTQGRPCTLWDAEDIAHYREMLTTSAELQAQYAGLLRAMDQRITQPVGAPQPSQGPDGEWLHLPSSEYGAIHTALALDIANLGAAYALSGEAKYAEFAKRILLAYADVFGRYGIGARPGFTHDPSKVFDQRLGDATWLIQVARGYDLIYNLPAITDDERRHIEDDLVRAAAKHILANRAMRKSPTNWSAIAMASVLMAGYATDDEELIRQGLYGGGSPEEIKGGAFYHFGSDCIDADGMWAEGAMGYQFMALEALVCYAEVAWRHGIDLYRYRDGAFKRLFDSPLEYVYPNLKTPAIHDSGHGAIVGRESFLYEFAYRRYRDPRYVPILNQAGMHLNAQFQQFPVSVLYDRDPGAPVEAAESKSVNFFGVGYGILRHTTGAGTVSLLLDYGPHRSHSHPDKLNIDLWAHGDRWIPDPGSVWYERPLYRRWYRPTLSHNTLIVDELDQRPTTAEQLVYGPGTSLSIQRARTNKAYPGVLMDRAVFLTSEYMADLFGAFARAPRTMDLAWHIRGEFASELATEPMTFPEPREMGYIELAEPSHVVTERSWSASFTRNDGETARFIAAGGADTDVIIADGHLGMERPKTILQRRTTAQTIYGNVVDISSADEGYVTNTTLDGSLEDGYALMTIWTATGQDQCFVAYRPGSHRFEPETVTDAQQLFLRRDDRGVRAAYMAGGAALVAPGIILSRNTRGLLVVERADTGAYVLSNPSADATGVQIGLPDLDKMDAWNLDAKGGRTDRATVTTNPPLLLLALPAAGAVEFAPPKAPSVYEHRQGMLRRRQAAAEAQRKLEIDRATERTRQREAAAKELPAPAGTIVVVQGEDFSAQGGGTIGVADHKRSVVGAALYGWDDIGHWIEWTVEAPADGYYHLSVVYCSELAGAERELRINGDVPESFAALRFAATGGWANNADDWRLWTAPNPVADHPLLIRLTAGANTIRLMNTNGRGVNIDYVIVSSPDVKLTRDRLIEMLSAEKG